MGRQADDGSWIPDKNETCECLHCHHWLTPQNVGQHINKCKWDQEVAEAKKKMEDKESSDLLKAIKAARHREGIVLQPGHVTGKSSCA